MPPRLSSTRRLAQPTTASGHRPPCYGCAKRLLVSSSQPLDSTPSSGWRASPARIEGARCWVVSPSTTSRGERRTFARSSTSTFSPVCSSDDVQCAVMMFRRRHVYEHNGGAVDDQYLRDSGDTSVRPKQLIRETPENVHRLANMVTKRGVCTMSSTNWFQFSQARSRCTSIAPCGHAVGVTRGDDPQSRKTPKTSPRG